MPVSASITDKDSWTSFSIFFMRRNNRCVQCLGLPTALAAAAFPILLLAVLDHVLLAGGSSLSDILSRVVGWLTLGSDCLILQLSISFSLALKCCVLFALGTG